ncbi:MAG: hypothetical protein NC453_11290 [Muribaculum sp.]|nr:hypothetical protein [Muribaculum sp.]
MENNRKIKVLWIDDNPTQFDAFLDDAYDKGLEIEVKRTVDSGLEALMDTNNDYEAIILDANCKISDEATEAPQLAALSHAIVGIYVRNIDLPWFVYTGGAYEGKDALEHIIPQKFRNWDETQWYKKPEDELKLFDAIKKAIANREDSKIKDLYPEAFKICGSQKLLSLLKNMNEQSFERDVDIPHIIREDVCVPLCHYLHENGIYPNDLPTDSSNLITLFSRFFANDKKNEYVPVYIQRMFHFLSEYANEGSHKTTKNNKVRDDIACGNAKYLNRTAVLAFLNIILWTSHFPIEDQEAMKPIHEFFYNLNKTSNERK